MRWRQFIFVWAILLLAIANANSQNPYRRDDNGHFIVEVGDYMPSFSYVTLDGDTLDTDFLRGQVCIIQFVASWCPFGKGQIKAVEDLIWRKYNKKSDKLSILGFTEDFPQDTAQFRLLIKEKGISYPFCFDTDERVFKLFATSKASVTRLIIVGEDGKIVSMEDEFYRKSFRRTRKTIKRLLKN